MFNVTREKEDPDDEYDSDDNYLYDKHGEHVEGIEGPIKRTFPTIESAWNHLYPDRNFKAFIEGVDADGNPMMLPDPIYSKPMYIECKKIYDEEHRTCVKKREEWIKQHPEEAEKQRAAVLEIRRRNKIGSEENQKRSKEAIN